MGDARGDRHNASDGTIARTLRVLKAVGQTPRASLSDIARVTGLPKSTVHRLLGTLQSERAVERDGAGYRLGSWSVELAGGVNCEWLRRQTMPYLVDLYADVGESVSLAVLRDLTVVYLETIYNRRQRQLILRTEPSAPAHATAAGKILLAHAPHVEERFDDDVALGRLTEFTITVPAQLSVELARIRREGVAVNHDEYVVGFSAVAVAMTSPSGRPCAAITVGAPSNQLNPTLIMPKLRAAAFAASLAIRSATARAQHAG